jgi:phospho-N-acetylmuramoyl-pentapeptide-transferase
LAGLNDGLSLLFDDIVAVMVLVLAYALLGMVDDYLTVHPVGGVRGISSKPKAFIQVVLATGFVLWLKNLGWEPVLSVAGHSILSGWLYWLFAVVFITGMANFVNITDGLDGLVSGLSAIAAVGLVSTVMRFPGDVVANQPILLSSIAGACVAFLWFNTNPAKVFMGDTGALALGAAFPAIAIIMHCEVLLIVISIVFVLDGLSTAVQWAYFKYTRIRTGTGKRVFLKSPIHHHFEMLGWPEQTVVVRFWICGVIAAVLGFAGAAMGWW